MKPNKYGAKKAECWAGHMHDSMRECRRCGELHLLQKAGKIAHLETQKQYWFEINGRPLKHSNGRRAGFKVDFFYVEMPAAKDVAEDSKGFTVRDYPLRATLFRHLFPWVELREV